MCIKTKRSKTQLPRSRVLKSRLVQTNSVETTTNKTEITEHSVLQELTDYSLHNPKPKGGVGQAGRLTERLSQQRGRQQVAGL